MLVDRNPAALVDHGAAVVGVKGYRDRITVAGEGLVDRVVHDLVDEVMEAPGSGRADIHSRPLPDGLETFENRDVLCPVGILGGGFLLSQSMPFRESVRRLLEPLSVDSRGTPVETQWYQLRMTDRMSPNYKRPANQRFFV
jgi:hypothetical protein